MDSFILTPLYHDAFGSSENPLSDGGKWGSSSSELEVVTPNCEAISSSAQALQPLSGVTLPDDQYSQLTVGQVDSNSNHYLYVRTASDFSSGYEMSTLVGGVQVDIINLSTSVQVAQFNTSTPVATGDVFVLGVIGSELFVLQNGTLLGTVTDSAFTSGFGGAGVWCDTVNTDTTFTDFKAGSVTQTPADITDTIIAYDPDSTLTLERKPNSATRGDGIIAYDSQSFLELVRS